MTGAGATGAQLTGVTGAGMTDARQWFAGAAHGLLWPDGLALVSATVGLPAAVDLWESAPASIGEFIAELHRVARGSTMPDFVAAMRTPTGWQVAVSQGFGVRVSGDETGDLTHVGTLAWTQRAFTGVDELVLATLSAPAEPAELAGRPGWRPALAALVPADAVRWAARVPAQGHSDEQAHEPGSAHAPATASPAAGRTPSSAEPDDVPGSFSHLWADTYLADRAVVPPSPAAAPSGPGAGSPRPRIPGPTPTGPTPSPPPSARPAGPAAGDHDGHTMLGPVARADGPQPTAPPQAPAPPPPPSPPPGAPSVLATTCPNSHTNPPQRATCRSCGAPVSGPPRQVPRPALGRLRFSSGEVVELTDPVIIGRAPRANQVTDRRLPRLCPIPRDHISGNHLQIRLEGWSVLAVDMHSRNGTLLHRRGEAPLRLPERPLPLHSGDVLDLGHGVWISVEEVP